MSARRITVDTLSRALCPSIDGLLLSNATTALPLRSARRVRVTQEQQHETAPAIGLLNGQARTAHTDGSPAGQRARRERYPQWAAAPQARPPKRVPAEKKPQPPPALPPFPGWAAVEVAPLRTTKPLSQDPSAVSKTDPGAQQQDHPGETATLADQPPEGQPPGKTGLTSADALCRSKSDLPPETAGAPTPVIYEALRSLRGLEGQGNKIRRLVRYLVEERGERPNVFLYEALVTANWDTATGSANELAEIYKEMRTAGIQPSPGWYHSALRLLAIHPDYLTRNTFLAKMKEQGIELGDEGKFSVAVGLLRDGQYEMALDYWDQLRDAGTRIPEWVSSTFVYVLAMRGFVDEAVQLFRQVLDAAGGSASAVPLPLWSYLLDECSRNLHYEGTRLVWDEMVSPGKINPADGIALNVLNTAARQGDTTLATAVIELLSAREVKLGFHHYEPLLESYVKAGSLEGAFRVLCIMNDAGVQPDQSSTRSLYAALKEGPPDLVDEAIGILRQLERVPVAAINVLLEALATGSGGDMTRTLDAYRQVCDLCQSGPNQQTFALLLDECASAEPAVFLVSEMDRFSVRPSPPILDSLIRCFALDGNLDVALLYLDEMSRLATGGSPTWVSRRTLLAVLQRCHKEKDPRASKLVAEARRRGMTL
ncbi:hypothetical protein MYCTH_2298988 [Thermothelomyces thermophilus ATCC 42464]|uniref:Pentatricopeptide repeat-containing protein-mitochondrial domain-containing protein n=1 Tax=Thermothelomyces thermophilus (strain ATCC 42464 / BCRC 31852 / DSM 1799) TaxID=573729 RepID=G2Q4A6_THET4|nr:uncharacterized protein MYCTH_2298988 [Thermothelomyces thermophilus ATCC 42464]AEO55301.1 hypothetical protein MYCTH_2298988 [Thermothelomyces thermophilus ATCC 42464]